MPRDPDLLPDWFLGGAGKRRLLTALFREPTAAHSWSLTELATAASLTRHNAVNRHLAVLELAGVLAHSPSGRWAVVDSSDLIPPLRAYLEAIDHLPPEALPRARGGSR